MVLYIIILLFEMYRVSAKYKYTQLLLTSVPPVDLKNQRTSTIIEAYLLNICYNFIWISLLTSIFVQLSTALIIKCRGRGLILLLLTS